MSRRSNIRKAVTSQQTIPKKAQRVNEVFTRIAPSNRGSGSIKVINNTPQADTGGQCYRLCRKVNNHYKNYDCRSFIGKYNYIRYPADMLYSKNVKDIKWVVDFWKNADVLHGHIHLRGVKAWPGLNPKAGKIVHQHGRLPRGSLTYKNINEIWAEDTKYNATRVVSTISLLRYIKGGKDPKRWFPTPVDVKWLKSFMGKTKKHDKIRVMHSPTVRSLKHTDLFLKVMKGLESKYDVETVMVENATHEETQRIRATCDIVYDQILLQHGSNALEAWAMGLPVIAGCIEDPVVLDDINDIVGYVPFYNATKATLGQALEHLIVNASTRMKYGRLGERYVNSFHSNAFVAKRAIETYEEVMFR